MDFVDDVDVVDGFAPAILQLYNLTTSTFTTFTPQLPHIHTPQRLSPREQLFSFYNFTTSNFTTSLSPLLRFTEESIRIQRDACCFAKGRLQPHKGILACFGRLTPEDKTFVSWRQIICLLKTIYLTPGVNLCYTACFPPRDCKDPFVSLLARLR